MEITGSHHFSIPRARVWQLLLDPVTLQQCLPGAEELKEVGPEEYETSMKIGVAAIRGTYQGRIKITDKDEPNAYSMAVEGKGPAGQISGTARIALSVSADGLSFTVTDDGAGYDAARSPLGAGLRKAIKESLLDLKKTAPEDVAGAIAITKDAWLAMQIGPAMPCAWIDGQGPGDAIGYEL